MGRLRSNPERPVSQNALHVSPAEIQQIRETFDSALLWLLLLLLFLFSLLLSSSSSTSSRGSRQSPPAHAALGCVCPEFDADGGGTLDAGEIWAFCAQLGLDFDEAELLEALAEMDKDNDRWRLLIRLKLTWGGGWAYCMRVDRQVANRPPRHDPCSEIDFEEFVAWWLSGSKAKKKGSVAYKMQKAREATYAIEMDNNTPMGRCDRSLTQVFFSSRLLS